MTVNGTAYPYLEVTKQAYRFRILNASNDRTINLSIFKADTSPTAPTPLQATSGEPMGTSTEVRMVGAVPPVFVGRVKCNEAPGAPIDPVTFLPASPAGCWPSFFPTDGRDGGVPAPEDAGPALIQIGSEGGLLPAPVVIPVGPNNYNYNRRDIVVLNVAQHGLFLMPAQRADVIVDFTSYDPGTRLILYNDAPAPVPAFDTRVDYYTDDPDQTAEGGAPTTLAGWGPNTRTVMQFVVTGSPTGTAAVQNLTALQTALPTAYAATQPPPIVPQPAYNAAFGTATSAPTYARISDTSLVWTPAGPPGTLPVTLPLGSKAIQELFTLDYGRMNATLGVEIPNTNYTIQTTIPYGYIDPITETVVDGQPTAWKITHNGVDTHPVHFHLFNVQVINRVGWDGAIRAPEPNELGWKETVTMNPLEDAIVAFMPVSMKNIPFGVPDSVRLLDVTAPEHSTGQFSGLDIYNNRVNTTNEYTNFGWEYVWHCHILGHEENDFMRPIQFVAKATMVSPTNGSKLPASGTATFTWLAGAGVSQTYIDVSQFTAGASDVFAGLATAGTAMTRTVTGMPYGATIYVRLYSLIGTTWMYNDYAYLSPLFGMITPVPGSTLTAPTINFTWGGASTIPQYTLWIGSSLGTYNLSASAYAGTVKSATRVLPAGTPGGTIYVRLWAIFGGVNTPLDYTYTYVPPVASTMISPTSPSTITSPVTFTWNAGTGIVRNYLYVGTSQGGTQIANKGPFTAGGGSTSVTIGGQPNNTTIYVRLVSQLSSGSNIYNDYTYTLSVPVTVGPPKLTAPTPGSLLGATATFTWIAPTNGTATNYYLYIGTTGPGSTNFSANMFAPTTFSYTRGNLPVVPTLYVRIMATVGGVNYFTDYTYRRQ
jgi:FtsP/CotA-like multicopper oxidase with cupredoxin domain